MNERIKELILEAGFPKFDKMYVVSDGEELEKFAELIVRECAMFVVTELEGKVGSAIADATANRLEKHFGVEE